MKQSVKENIVKWVLTSLLVTIGGTATTFFGLTLLDRIPVTLSTDERFYLNELPDTFQMIEDYLGIESDDIFLEKSLVVFFDEEERISQLSFKIFVLTNGIQDSYSVYYEKKQIKIALVGKYATEEYDGIGKLSVVVEGLSKLSSMDSNLESYLFVSYLEISTILFSDEITRYLITETGYQLITANTTGRFIEISLIEEQSGNTLAMYYIPVNS